MNLLLRVNWAPQLTSGQGAPPLDGGRGQPGGFEGMGSRERVCVLPSVPQGSSELGPQGEGSPLGPSCSQVPAALGTWRVSPVGSPYPLQGSSCYWGCPTSSTPPLSPLSQHLTPPPASLLLDRTSERARKSLAAKFWVFFFFLNSSAGVSLLSGDFPLSLPFI